MEYLRSISNQAKGVGFYLHAPCGILLCLIGNPRVILGFYTNPAGPPSPFTTSMSHAKIAHKKRDLRSLEVHARRLEKLEKLDRENSR
jgi:hypothetical protein